MIPAERQKTILTMLSKQEVISINDLVDRIGVSHMTIRRDIVKLEEQGKVLSVSGGVQLTQLIHREATHDAKAAQNADEKQGIGQLASSLIPENCTVYLDAGTTTLEIAHAIAHRSDLLVITNDFVVANHLMQHGQSEIYHTGGRIDRDNQSSVGSKVAEFLSGMNIDIAFISTSSWNLKGISTPSEPKVIVKQAVANAAQHLVLVSDSSKYGRIGTFHALGLNRFNAIVTDKNFPESIAREIKEKGIDVLL